MNLFLASFVFNFVMVAGTCITVTWKKGIALNNDGGTGAIFLAVCQKVFE